MGNRAVITIGENDTINNNAPAVYLHWNGGVESVLAFLEAAKKLGVRQPGGDKAYFLSRFIQIIGNTFGGSLSLGAGTVGSLDSDNGDNGLYIVGGDFKIMARHYTSETKTSLEAGDDIQRHNDFVADIISKNTMFAG